MTPRSLAPPHATVPDALRALETRDGWSLAVYDRRGKEAPAQPYPELVVRARAWGAWLREQGVSPGDVVFLCLPTSHELVEAFLGAIVVRALPCCLALPRAIGGLESFRRRLELLAGRYPGGQLVTTADVGAELDRPYLLPPELDLSRLAPLEPVDPAALAYVQLTSGSTAVPKAVSITHANLSANTRAIVLGGHGLHDETYVSWLPLYHDMGLVGILLTGLFHGVGLCLMRPETFVGTPLRWLEAIAAQRTPVVTSAPNFGYQWCVDRIRPEKLEGLDLSPWRLACCGAEMVRPGTLSAFQERFGPLGFREGVFAPCYGMAETTLAVTISAPGRPPLVHEGRVSCGPVLEGLSVSIHAPGDGAPLPDGVEGEVVVRGSSVFPGYFLDDEATAESLRPDGAFHTGDLGYLREGELYLTGRLKDLIILDGANVAPYELEWIAEQHVDMDGGRAAAFSVEREGREAAVLVVEVKALPPAATIDALRSQVAQDVAPLLDLVFVRRGTLPKTSSGKVQRGEVRRLYAAGELDALWSWAREGRAS
ncbi:MAG: AMP-binding protein [Planctomycetota bacterium]